MFLKTILWWHLKWRKLKKIKVATFKAMFMDTWRQNTEILNEVVIVVEKLFVVVALIEVFRISKDILLSQCPNLLWYIQILSYANPKSWMKVKQLNLICRVIQSIKYLQFNNCASIHILAILTYTNHKTIVLMLLIT